MKDLPQDLQHASFRRRANRRVSDGIPTEKRGGAPAGYKRLHGELNALTITSAAPHEFIHPIYNRTLTLRECARLQSFPDDFNFNGKANSIAKQIGNAIPPLVAKIIAESILKEDGMAGADIGKNGSNALGLIGFCLTNSEGMSPALMRTATALQEIMSVKEKFYLT
jgi:DNA (cytosine-5)-methyltransferase 1